MAGPLIPKKLREEYEALEARRTVALFPAAGGASDWSVVADLTDELSDLYRRIGAATYRDELLTNVFTRAAHWAQMQAQGNRKLADQQVKR